MEQNNIPENDSGQSIVIPALIAFAGACIGALPGAFVWVKMRESGFILDITALLMGIGAYLAGFRAVRLFSRRKNDIAQAIGCAAAVGIVLLVAVHTGYVHALKKGLEEYRALVKADYTEQLREEGYSESEIAKYASFEEMNSYVCEKFRINEISYKECSAHFQFILDKMDMKKSMRTEYAKSILFGWSGVMLPIRKFKEKTAI